jgi:hypothetical protein
MEGRVGKRVRNGTNQGYPDYGYISTYSHISSYREDAVFCFSISKGI